MKSNVRFLLGVAVLALAALACQAVTGGGDSGNDIPPVDVPDVNTEEPAPLPTETEAASADGDVMLSDDFSSERWGTGTDADSSVEYAEEALQFIVYKENFFVWSTPDSQTYKDVHVEATVINHDTDSTTAIGIMCNKSVVDNFYYMVFTPAGQYAIAKAAVAQNDLFLTNDDKWANSDLITLNASSYRVGADCGNGRLTLYVDGQEIASVEDATYTEGYVALVVLSGVVDDGQTYNVSFDDFVMTELP